MLGFGYKAEFYGTNLPENVSALWGQGNRVESWEAACGAVHVGGGTKCEIINTFSGGVFEPLWQL